MIRKYLLMALSLLGSLFIYLFYRTQKTAINEIAISLLSESEYQALRESIRSALPLNDPTIYSLPEGLWVFCITLTSQSFYFKFRQLQLACVYLPPVVALGFELFQLLGITKGRFDVVDIAVSLLFWMLAQFLFPKNREQDLLASFSFRNSLCVLSYCIVYLAHVFD